MTSGDRRGRETERQRQRKRRALDRGKRALKSPKEPRSLRGVGPGQGPSDLPVRPAEQAES